jgi:vacuolar-type H+-ATPase subunit E/Vma4
MEEKIHTEIVEEILREAHREATGILQHGEESVSRRGEALERRLEEIARNADARATAEEDRLRAKYARTRAMEEKRIRLALNERVVQAVLDNVRETMQEWKSRRDGPDDRYGKIITAWAVEAVLGLGATPAGIRYAPEDRDVLVQSLEEIKNRYRSAAGQAGQISLSDDPLPAGTLGVVVVDASGRRAFSNRLEDRIRRSMDRIHRCVAEVVLKEPAGE